MIHGYHLILPMYGFWLPNDPRGSWSEFVWKWELARFGKATKTLERRDLSQLSERELRQREAALKSLRFPPVTLNGNQAACIATAFARQRQTSSYTIWACAILPQHTHLVIARHRYAVEQVARLLKGAATTRLTQQNLHPLQTHAINGRPPRPWAESLWKIYLDTEEQIETAIRYVEENPVKEGKPRQNWRFVTPFRGLEPGTITCH